MSDERRRSLHEELLELRCKLAELERESNHLIAELAKISSWNAAHIEEKDKLKEEVSVLRQTLSAQIAITQDDWKKEATYLKSHRDEIKTLLVDAIKLLRLPHSMCEVSHHSKKDRHELWDDCPIDKRVDQLLKRYDDLVFHRKKP